MSGRQRPQSAGLPGGQRPVAARIRIIGGSLRGRTVPYNGDASLRPMKDRVREAVFNLIGPRVRNKRVVDLFAGTGAMSFEAISRGAATAELFERKFPTAKLIESTAAEFGLDDRMHVNAGDTFVWSRKLQLGTPPPSLIFCCPPYEFFVSRRSELVALVGELWAIAIPTSLLVVECDERFRPDELIPQASWDIRSYPPATIGLVEKPAELRPAH